MDLDDRQFRCQLGMKYMQAIFGLSVLLDNIDHDKAFDKVEHPVSFNILQ